MFRDLIPRLATRYRLVAPDHVGFGHSAAPAVNDFDYTFLETHGAQIARLVDDFLGRTLPR